MNHAVRQTTAVTRVRIGTAGLLLASVALLSACSEPASDTDSSPTVGKAPVGPIPAYEQQSGDAAAGYEAILDADYASCGPPYDAWRRVTPATAQPSALPRSGAGSLPYFMSLRDNADGVRIVTTNCLLCHGGTFEGEVVVGLGNEGLDFTGDPRDAVDAIGSYVGGKAETAAWQKWAARISAIAPYMITDTVGANPAPNLTLALIAHRDRDTLAWSDEPLLEPPRTDPLPVSVPPWWRMSKKHAMFYNGMGRGDHARYMMMKSLVCADSIAEVEALDAAFADVRAFIASLEPPAYPYAVDGELAVEGEAVFNDHCSACHGTYGENPSYPNLVIDLDTVGTDPAYARQAYDDGERFMNWFNGSWYGERAVARPAAGYVAPPLDAVWMTAPFLHNGSVPTIAALLDSGTRPVYWSRDPGAVEFDQDALGWHYVEHEQGRDGADTERARIYDTTREGYSNAGHTFGDVLTDAQRTAVIEYLKTL